MARRRQLTDEPTFNKYPILTDKEKGLKCDKKIMKTVEKVIDHMVMDHGMDRILVKHYEFRFPKGFKLEDANKNEQFRNAQGKIIKNFTRQGTTPHYVAVREQDSKDKVPHYHLLLCCDERKSNVNVVQTMDPLWSSSCGLKETKTGLIQDCSKGDKKHVIKINAPDAQAKLDSLFQHGSYLAKENQKEHNHGTRELFTSRLNHEVKEKKRKSK